MAQPLEDVLEDGHRQRGQFVADGRRIMLAWKLGKLDEFLQELWERNDGDHGSGGGTDAEAGG